MIVCPICEHQQQAGSACDNCGKQLIEPAPVAYVVEPMPGLEVNGLVTEGGGSPGDERVPDLEVTRLPAVGMVPDEVLPELERTAHASDGLRTALPAVPVCRYCGAPQATGGALCDGCGRALPSVRRAEPAPVVESTRAPCPSCGTMALQNARCPSCGTLVRTRAS